MKFKVGDYVVCTNPTYNTCYGKTYRVTELYSFAGTMRCTEVATGKDIKGINMNRFINDKESTVRQILNKIDNG